VHATPEAEDVDTAPFAMAATFDAPSGEACVARRDLSNTPLQALTLLNDTVKCDPPIEYSRRSSTLLTLSV
jgi:hypothetical protein